MHQGDSDTRATRKKDTFSIFIRQCVRISTAKPDRGFFFFSCFLITTLARSMTNVGIIPDRPFLRATPGENGKRGNHWRGTRMQTVYFFCAFCHLQETKRGKGRAHLALAGAKVL
jgi:hypothetical protein